MTEAWQDLSVLAAGCGSIGKRHTRLLRSMGLRDIRVCDPNPDQIRGLVKESPDVAVVDSFEAGLETSPDAVFILTPPTMHIPMAIQAIRAGCHVFCEKPLSETLDGFNELDKLLEETGRKMMVGLCFRFHEGLLRAKKLLEEGKIGRLVSVRALMGEHLPEMRPDYRSTHMAKSSGAFDLMHDVDLAIWYANQDVKEVRCMHGPYSDIGIEAPDVVEILMDFEDRCLASVHLDFFQLPRRRQMELIGTRGVIIVEFASWDRSTLSVYDVNRQAWESETINTVRDDMFTAEDREFLEAVAQNRPVTCDIHEAAKSVGVVAVARSC